MAATDSRVITLGDLSRFKQNMDVLLANKLDKQNPTGNGSLSMNRLTGSTTGTNSTTLGSNNEASGANSFAAGENSKAGGNDSIALGKTVLATGSAALAEGLGTKASGNNQHVQGKYNIEDNNNTYADIIGNGTSDNNRSNAATVDWNGNAWFAGEISVGAPATKLAKEKELKVTTDDWNNLVDKHNTILTVNRILSTSSPSFVNNSLNFSDDGKIYLVDNVGDVVTYSDYNAIELADLLDIDLSALADGDILVYNSATQKWENQIPPASKDNLSDLNDVDINSAANNEVLKYNSVSGKWENGTVVLPTPGHTVKDNNSTYAQRAGLQFIGLDVSDDNTNNNTVITADISNLNDTNISNPANGQVLKYNTSNGKWENQYEINGIEGHHIKDSNGTVLTQRDNLQFEGADVTDDNANNNTKVNINIASLTDTNLSNSLADGYTLVYDTVSGKWIDKNDTLDNLNNVNISSLSDGQVIKYNATSGKWENANDTGINNLVDLNDVNVISLADGQILKYDSSTHKWVNATLPTQVNSDWNATSGPAEILNKPTIPAAQVNSDWNASSGVAEILNKPTLGTAAAKDVPVTGDASSTEVVMGNDSRLTDARSASDVSSWAKASNKPTYDYSEITNTPNVPSALDDLSDVSTTGVISGKFLKYNGTAWVPGDASTGGVSDLIDLGDVSITSLADGQLLRYNNTSQKWENSNETPQVNSDWNAVSGVAEILNKPSIPTKTSDLTNDSDFVVDASYVHTDNNYTTAEQTKLAGISSGADVNVIEAVKVNGTALTPDANKAVDITVPTKTSDLTNDSNFVVDASYVHTDNNYSTSDKNKLAGIDSGAQVNVKPDWNATPGDPDEILNKPTIPAAQVNSDWNSTSGVSEILNKPANLVQDASYVHTDNNYTTAEKTKLSGIEAGAQVNVQSDWNQTNSSADDYIKNKPTIPSAQVNSDWNATSGIAEILNKPTLGTAAALNVPATGNASSTEVVKGDDTRLTDARTPVSHTHVMSDITNLGTAAGKDVPTTGDASSIQVVMGNDSRLTDSRPASDVAHWAKAATKPTYDYSEITNTPTIPSSIDDLGGVSISYPSDGQVLKYDGTNQVWVNANETHEDDLFIISGTIDISTSVITVDKTPTEVIDAYNSGKVLQLRLDSTIYNLIDANATNGNFIFSALMDNLNSIIGLAKDTSTTWTILNKSTTLAMQCSSFPSSSVSSPIVQYIGATTSSYKNGYFYKYSNGTWNEIQVSAGGGGASDLEDLGDVNITTPTNGQVLKYNLTTQKWENSNESSGGDDIFKIHYDIVTEDPITITITETSAEVLAALNANKTLLLVPNPLVDGAVFYQINGLMFACFANFIPNRFTYFFTCVLSFDEETGAWDTITLQLIQSLLYENPRGEGSLSFNRLESSRIGSHSVTLNGGQTVSRDIDNYAMTYVGIDPTDNTIVIFHSTYSLSTGYFNRVLSFTDNTNNYELPLLETYWDGTANKNVYKLDNAEEAYNFSTTDTYYATHSKGSTKNIASGACSLAIGMGTQATNAEAVALGVATFAGGATSLATGYETLASGQSSIAGGSGSKATGYCSTAIGQNAEASESQAHAEGYYTQASGVNSHAEGATTVASGFSAHSEGEHTTASASNAHAEGYFTTANGYGAHAEGAYTIAKGQYQHVEGKYNIQDNNDTYVQIIGNGTTDQNRSNAATIDWSGNAWFAGDVSVGTPNTKLAKEKELKLVKDEWVNAPQYDDYTQYFYDSLGQVSEYLNGCTKDSGTIPIDGTTVYDVPAGWNQVQFNITDSATLNRMIGKTIEFGACGYSATFTTAHYLTIRYKDGTGDHYIFVDTVGQGSQNFSFNSSGIATTLVVPSDCEYITVYYAAGTHAPIATAGKLTLTNIYAFDINEYSLPDQNNSLVNFYRYGSKPVTLNNNSINFIRNTNQIIVTDNMGNETVFGGGGAGSAEYVKISKADYDLLTYAQKHDLTKAYFVYDDDEPVTPPSYIELTGTLTAGNTSISFTNSAITSTCCIDVYSDNYNANLTNQSVSNNTLTLTFDALQTDLAVKVRIS